KLIDSSSMELSVNAPGLYKLIITSYDCHLTSNEVKIETFDEKLLVLDQPTDLVILEGETKTVTASGAQSYEWFDAGNNLVSSTDSFGFQEEGEYLLIADFGSCTLSRVITVTFRDLFAIPNVITANGDGINDLWVLPNSYSRDPNVLVTIFNERGEQIFSQSGYENNWPQSTTAFNKPSMIFYYKISRGGNSLKQGTITVIKSIPMQTNRPFLLLSLLLLVLTGVRGQEEDAYVPYNVPSQNLLKFNRFLINPTFSTVREDK